MAWKFEDRPGYFGQNRNEIYCNYNQKYGKDNWRIVWDWGNKIILSSEATQIYEDAYYEYLKRDKSLLDWLILTASDVYDTAPSNIESGFNYNIQETTSNHIHDIAIRRSVLRLGFQFNGDHLVEVRPKKEGEPLGPYLIPFHLPCMIYRGPIKYKGKDRDFKLHPPWWREMGIKDSIEEFYQQNKILEIKL